MTARARSRRVAALVFLCPSALSWAVRAEENWVLALGPGGRAALACRASVVGPDRARLESVLFWRDGHGVAPAAGEEISIQPLGTAALAPDSPGILFLEGPVPAGAPDRPTWTLLDAGPADPLAEDWIRTIANHWKMEDGEKAEAIPGLFGRLLEANWRDFTPWARKRLAGSFARIAPGARLVREDGRPIELPPVLLYRILPNPRRPPFPHSPWALDPWRMAFLGELVEWSHAGDIDHPRRYSLFLGMFLARYEPADRSEELEVLEDPHVGYAPATLDDETMRLFHSVYEGALRKRDEGRLRLLFAKWPRNPAGEKEIFPELLVRPFVLEPPGPEASLEDRRIYWENRSVWLRRLDAEWETFGGLVPVYLDILDKNLAPPDDRWATEPWLDRHADDPRGLDQNLGAISWYAATRLLGSFPGVFEQGHTPETLARIPSVLASVVANSPSISIRELVVSSVPESLAGAVEVVAQGAAEGQPWRIRHAAGKRLAHWLSRHRANPIAEPEGFDFQRVEEALWPLVKSRVEDLPPVSPDWQEEQRAKERGEKYEPPKEGGSKY